MRRRPERLKLELALQLALGPTLMANEGFASQRAAVAYLRARNLAGRLGDNRPLFAALWGTWLSTSQGRKGDEAVQELVAELFRTAEPSGAADLQLQAHHAAWATMLWTGALTSTREHVERGLALYDREKHGKHALLYGGHDPAVCGAGQGACALWMLGHVDQAMASVRRCLALADDLAHVPSVGHATWLTGFVHMLRSDAPSALATGERAIALGREHGYVMIGSAGGIMRGWARGRLGAQEEGLAEMRKAVSAYRGMAGVMLTSFLTALAEAECGPVISTGRKRPSLTPKRWSRSAASLCGFLLSCASRGDLQAARTPADPAAAADLYEQSIAAAKELEAMSLQLQAAIRLVRIRRTQGRVREARELLAPIVGWFTEGFDTPDLIEATALLKEIGA